MEIKEEDTQPKPRTLMLGFAFFKEHGFAGLLRLRFDHVALDAAVGSMPVLLLIQDQSGNSLDMKFGMSLHADAGPVIFFSDKNKKFQNGIRLSGIYDSILGAGGQVGWAGELAWTRFVLGFGAGIQVYPDYKSKVSKHFDLPEGQAKDDPGTGSVQIYFGVSTAWYVL